MSAYQMHQEKNCILIVDDDMINREVLKNIFAAEYCFEEAEDGMEGLCKIEQCKDKLCAVLLDVNMPVMDGIELLTELHTRGITEGLPIFLITSNEESAVAREAYELGVMDVITKPVTPFIILRRVQSVVELFRAREALRERVLGQEKKLQENADTIDALHRNTIEALASAIEFRDVESGEHTNRIYGITKHLLLHTEMGEGYDAKDIENMAIGSIMHDIGKIAISDVILNKPGKLTREEFEIMKQHTVKGGELMEQLAAVQSHPSYLYAVDIARHHHERWDGGGYPDGLRGDEISVWSQVTSIADVYDALVSPRVYKRAFTADEAVNMIKNGECGAFNPKLIKCFLEAEPVIRSWYSTDSPAAAQTVMKESELTERLRKSQEQNISDLLLLTQALRASYSMVIGVNLTQNTYHMIDYDQFQTKCASFEGVFDDLIATGATTIPESHRKLFQDTFGREALLQSYAEGKKAVRLEHPQYGDDGVCHMVSTGVLFMTDPRTGDICEVTLSRYMD